MHAIRGLAIGGLLMLVAGCEQMDGVFGAGTPPAPKPVIVTEGLSPESEELKAYYARVESGHRTRGLLRVDGGGPDVPFDERRLSETFMSVAFAREFTDAGASLVRREEASILHRWEKPVRIEPIFGASVGAQARVDDTATLRRFADRLAKATGHPVSLVERGGNFRVLIVSEEERRIAGPTLQRLIPSIREREIDVIENLDRASYCLVVAEDANNDGVITQAVAVIRTELPLLLRLSCFHEELAQGMGLANDSPRARPSIFNDDDEFGRLTTMDERMLSMLYDPRLTPGMDATTARPIVAQLAAAQLGRNF